MVLFDPGRSINLFTLIRNLMESALKEKLSNAFIIKAFYRSEHCNAEHSLTTKAAKLEITRS